MSITAKTVRLLLCFVVALMGFSCELDGGERHQPRSYILILSFRDAAGNDLVDGLEGTEPEGSINGDHVKPELYELISSPSLYELRPSVRGREDPYPKLTFSAPRENPTPGLGSSPPYDGYYLLGISMTTTPKHKGLSTITYTLTCPHVFGDEAAHEIVTYWRKPSSGRSYYRACYRVEVDGREFTDITYASGEQLSFATIVLER